MPELRYKEITLKDWCFDLKSVKSINQCQSVVQTVYDIVKAHGGEIKINSEEGIGSAFVIVLTALPI